MMLLKSRRQKSKVSSITQRDINKFPLVMVTLFCVDDAALAKSIKFHTGRRHQAIFVTTTMNYGLFRAKGAVAEVFPGRDWPRGSSDDYAFSLYLKERWRVVLTKWAPDYLVIEGLEFPRYVEEMGKVHRVAPDVR